MSNSSEACSERLLLQPLVGLGQLLLLALQLLGQRLRLFQQLLGAHTGGDGVEHNRDAFGQLIEEGQVNLAEPMERRQLNRRLDLAFEHHRQHHNIERRRLAQARADLDVIGRHLGEQNALLLQRALARQPFAQRKPAGQVLALTVCVAVSSFSIGCSPSLSIT